MRIPFNKPFLTGKETDYIREAVASGKISGDGLFTQKCHRFFEAKYGFAKCLLTTSCTDALEMAAILLDIQPGDEVIAPAYTFVSTVNAFVLRGARIVFADSQSQIPNIDLTQVATLIGPKTKAIVVVHYAGVACDMDKVLALAQKHNLWVVEDCAHAIDSFYQQEPLGSLGHLGAFSFHETKNVIAGEGGMLTINDKRLANRAEIIREKGTNRSAFFRGEVAKYDWVDIGSSFLPSDIIAAFLYAQLENLENIQTRRKAIWQTYYEALQPLQNAGWVQLPHIPDFATNNGHMFYLICQSLEERNALIAFLKKQEIWAVFHYLSLHTSPYYQPQHDGRVLPNSDHFADCLVRLPFYYALTTTDQEYIINYVKKFYEN